MDLHSRRALMDSMSERYRRAAKRSKTRILDEVCNEFEKTRGHGFFFHRTGQIQQNFFS